MDTQPAWMRNKLSGLKASCAAGGWVRYPTYHTCFYLLLLSVPALGHQQGIFGDAGALWFAQTAYLLFLILLAIPEMVVVLQVGCAAAGLKYTLKTGKIECQPGTHVSFVFERPMGFSNKNPKFNGMIDVSPKLLSYPIGIAGSLNLKSGGHDIEIKDLWLRIIGFNRYRVTACEGLIDMNQPHICARINETTDVLVLGRHSADNHPPQQRYEGDLLIIEARAFEDFLQYNMFRVLFLTLAFSFQMLTW